MAQIYLTGPNSLRLILKATSFKRKELNVNGSALRVPYRHFRHPDRLGLLVANFILQVLVPKVGAGLQVNTCCEEKHRERDRQKRCPPTTVWLFIV